MALVCRDHLGHIKHIASKHCLSHSAIQAEVMAIYEGIKFSELHPSIPIEIESDCQAAVNMLNGTSNSVPWEIVSLIETLS